MNAKIKQLQSSRQIRRDKSGGYNETKKNNTNRLKLSKVDKNLN